MPERIVERDDLCREARLELRATEDASGDGLTIDGIAAVFNTPTRIDSWEGTFDEQIAFGAFRKSISERMPKLQFDHGHHPLIGSLPIGRWDAMEEKRGVGLHVVGRLHDNWLVDPVRDAIAEGSVDGMSFRFSVVREEWRDKTGKLVKAEDVMRLLWDPGDQGPLQRTLKEVKITEAGPVVWPAYQQTSVGVRSKVVIDLGRLTDPAERSKLAEAVFLADAATRTTGAASADESDDAPPANQEQPDEHPAEEEAAPPVSEPSSGEHPSAPPQRAKNPAKEFAVHARGYLLSIERN